MSSKTNSTAGRGNRYRSRFSKNPLFIIAARSLRKIQGTRPLGGGFQNETITMKSSQ
jgi:hypothetical protein